MVQRIPLPADILYGFRNDNRILPILIPVFFFDPCKDIFQVWEPLGHLLCPVFPLLPCQAVHQFLMPLEELCGPVYDRVIHILAAFRCHGQVIPHLHWRHPHYGKRQPRPLLSYIRHTSLSDCGFFRLPGSLHSSHPSVQAALALIALLSSFTPSTRLQLTSCQISG